jgi:hypothetical protein
MESEAAARLQVLHRQMYADLIRAYLKDYGSQAQLARAIGVTEAYVSLLLEPLHAAGSKRREARWTAVLQASGHEIADEVKFLKSPSEERADQIARELCTDRDRRDVLRHHINLARKPRPGMHAGAANLAADEAESALSRVGDIHQIALFDPRPDANRAAYLEVWSRAEYLAAAIDPVRSPVPHAQALMFQHDAAQVFNRPDLALGHARRAILVIAESCRSGPQEEAATRLRVNALLAETVSLNTLGLAAGAMAVLRQAEQVPGYRHEPQSWLRSFLEQRLSAMTRSSRLSIYDAEKTASDAAGLAASDAVLQAGISRRLLDVYAVHASARSRRKADGLAARLGVLAATVDSLTPLRRAQILVTLCRYHRASGDLGAAANAFVAGMSLTTQASLFHQQQELLSA